MVYKPFEHVQYILSELKNTNYITYKTIDKATIVSVKGIAQKDITINIHKNNLLLKICKNHQKRSLLHIINDIVYSIIYLLKANHKINLY